MSWIVAYCSQTKERQYWAITSTKLYSNKETPLTINVYSILHCLFSILIYSYFTLYGRKSHFGAQKVQTKTLLIFFFKKTISNHSAEKKIIIFAHVFPAVSWSHCVSLELLCFTVAIVVHYNHCVSIEPIFH